MSVDQVVVPAALDKILREALSLVTVDWVFNFQQHLEIQLQE
jgi:hypothetical protein